MSDAGVFQRHNSLVYDKILRRHQNRLTIGYVRRSSVQLVESHQELMRLQYALADWAA